MPLISPWAYTTTDANGKTLTVTITFDNTLLTLLTITSQADAGCAYGNFYIGLGADGIPNSSASQFAVAAGTAVVALSVLNGFGFTTVNDVLAHQVTAGP